MNRRMAVGLWTVWMVLVLGVLCGVSAVPAAGSVSAPSPMPRTVITMSSWTIQLASADTDATRRVASAATEGGEDERLAGVSFGPVDAVEQKVEELDEKANDYWQTIYDLECNGDTQPGDCSGDGDRIPTRVWEFWRNNEGAQPGSFGSVPATGSHGDDGSTTPSAQSVNETRSPVWTVTTDGPVTSSPALGSDGTVYVSGRDGRLYAIAPGGTVDWSVNIGGAMHSSPMVGPDTNVYVGNHNGRIYSVAPGGVTNWRYNLGDWVTASPAMGSDSTIYVGAVDGTFVALDADGTERWSVNLGDSITTSAAIAGDSTIYVGTWGNELVALNADGTEKWRHGTDGPIKSSPAIGADGTIYVGSSDQHLYAINPDGTRRWRSPTDGAVTSSPAIGADSTVYVGSWDHHLYAFQPDGTRKWRFRTGKQITASPTVGDSGVVYIGSADGAVYGITTGGTGVWKTETGDPVSSSVALGSAYVGSGDGNLYSLDVDATGLAESPWPRFRKNNKGDGSGQAGEGVTPTIQIQSPVADADTNVSPITVAGASSNANAGDSVQLMVNATPRDTVAVGGGGNWSSPAVNLVGGTNTLTATLYDTSTSGVANDSATVTVRYDTVAPAIDTALVRVGDGVDTYGYANLAGDSILRANRDITLSVPVADADTVTAFYTRSGTPPLTSDTPLTLSIAGTGATYDTWQGTVPSTRLSYGDTLGFLIRSSDKATNVDSDARGGTGYRVRIDRPAYSGPTWYVNDSDTTGDVYTLAPGSDTTGNGSASFPFASISQAMTQVRAGDTVRVDAGTYGETVVIDTNALTLAGADSTATVLDFNDSSTITSGILAQGRTGVAIRNLRVVNSFEGIDFDNTSNSRIERVATASNGNRGVVVRNGSNLNTLTNNESFNNTSRGFQLRSDSNTLTNSLSRDNSGAGIYLDSAGNTVANNVSSNNNDHGVVLGSIAAASNTIDSNVSRNNTSRGFDVTWGGTNTFTRNISVNNGAEGFYFVNSSNNTLANNVIRNNSASGFRADGVTGIQLVQNSIRSNTGWGISIENGASNGTFTKNNITTSATNPDSGLSNTSGNAHTITNNYWNTTDLNGIAQRVADPINSVSPYRLGVVDTGIGADIIGPAQPTIVSQEAGDGTTAIEWTQATATDFQAYRVYRDTDSAQSDWKQNADLVATINTVTDTGHIDTGVINGDTYYYRVTAVDNTTPENESFFSDSAAVRPAHDGPVWYVNDNSTAGDSFTTAVGKDTNTGSANDPFRSISKAMTKVSAGDTVRVDAGTYVDTVTINTNDLSFVGVDSGATILTSNDSGSVDSIGFSADSQSGISIRDLRITDMYHAVEFTATNQSRLERVSVDRSGNQAIRYMVGSDTTTIENVVVTGGPTMAFNVEGTNATIRNSVAQDNGGNGFRLANSSNSLIAGNRSINNGFKGIVISNTVKSELRNNVSRDNSTQSGFQLDNGSDTNLLVNNLSVNNGDDGFSIAGSANTIKLNDMKNNANYGVVIDNGNSNRIAHNNLLTNGVWNVDGNTIPHNWWGTTDESTISGRIDVSVDSAIPYRLGEVDTGVGADTLAPSTPVADTAIAGNQSIEVRWQSIPNTDGDFTEYRVYRDTTLTSNWKQNGTLVATNNTVTDTNIVDSGLINGQTYYYRITAVDNHTPENESYFSDTMMAVPTVGPLGFDTSSLVAYNTGLDTLSNSANELDGGFSIDFADTHFYRVRAQNADTVALFYTRDGSTPTTADTSFVAPAPQTGMNYDTWTVSLWSYGSFNEFAVGDTISFMLRATKATTGDTRIIDNGGTGYRYGVSRPNPVFDTSTMAVTDSFDTITGGNQFDGTLRLSKTVDTHTATIPVAYADTVISYVNTGAVATDADTAITWNRTTTGSTTDIWQGQWGAGQLDHQTGDSISFVVEARQSDGDTTLINRGGPGFNYLPVDDHFDTTALTLSNGIDTLTYSQLLGGQFLNAGSPDFVDTHVFSVNAKNADTVLVRHQTGGVDALNDTQPDPLTLVSTGTEYDTWQITADQREDIGETVSFVFEMTEATPGPNSDTELLDPGGIGFNYRPVGTPFFDTASLGVTDGSDTLFNVSNEMDGSQALSAQDTNTVFARVTNADSVWTHYTLDGSVPTTADSKVIWSRADTSANGDTWVDVITPAPLNVGDTPTLIIVAKNPAGDTTIIDRGGAGYSWQLTYARPKFDTTSIQVTDNSDTLFASQLNGDTFLTDNGTGFTIRSSVANADTVNVYYTRTGVAPTTADSSVTATNTTSDTFRADIPSTAVSVGDTVNFIIEAIDPQGDTTIADSGGVGYQYWIKAPPHAGPTWYVNDTGTVNDVYTSNVGSDKYHTGSSTYPFRSISVAMNHVSSGDTVRVDAGTFGETVAVDTDSLALVGADSSATGTVLSFGDTSSATGATGISADTQTDLYVNQLRVTNSYNGIEWANVDNSTIDGVTIQANGNYGVRLRGASNFNSLTNNKSVSNSLTGFALEGSDNNDVSSNVAFGNGLHGYALNDAANNSLTNNKSTNNSSDGFRAGNPSGIMSNVFDSNLSNSNDIGFSVASEGDSYVNNISRNNGSIGFSLSSPAIDNRLFNNESLNNTSHGFRLDSNSGNTLRNNSSANNGGSGFYNTLTSNNVLTQNDADSNATWGFFGGSASDTITKNNIIPSPGTDSGMTNSGTHNSIERNWWGTTDETVVDRRTDGIASGFIPYRLDKVDTGVGADTVAPASPVADQVVVGTGSLTVRWSEVTQDEDGSGLDFSEYRVYRTTSDTLTDWKQNATVVANLGTVTDTDFVDNGVSSGDTYYYRVTAVDNPTGLENESFFSDTMAGRPQGQTISVTSIADGHDTRVSPVNISGQSNGATAGDSVEIYVDGGLTVTTSILADSSWSAVGVTLSDAIGTRTVDAVLYDTGTASPALDTATLSVVYDTETPTVPVLASPADGAETRAQPVPFGWQASSDSYSGVRDYRIEIGTDSSFLKSDTYTVLNDTALNLAADTTFHWRMLSRDNAGNTSGYTVADTFVVDRTDPSTPTPLSPISGSETSSLNVVLDWADASDTLSGLARYDFRYDSGATVDTNAVSGTTALSNTTLALGASGQYVWQVSAVDDAGNTTPFTGPDTFVVDASPIFDTTTLQVTDASSTDVLTYNDLTGDSNLSAGDTNTVSVGVASADTMTLYYRKDGAVASTTDTAVPMSNIVGDTWEGKISPSEINVGDTINFILEGENGTTGDTARLDRSDSGFRYWVKAPSHNGPTWYVNDTGTVNDVYTSNTGSDFYHTGSSTYPFRTISHAMTRVSAGDTVRVDAGTYGETVAIDTNSLALVGADSSPNGTVIDFGDSSVSSSVVSSTSQNNLLIKNLATV